MINIHRSIWRQVENLISQPHREMAAGLHLPPFMRRTQHIPQLVSVQESDDGKGARRRRNAQRSSALSAEPSVSDLIVYQDSDLVRQYSNVELAGSSEDLTDDELKERIQELEVLLQNYKTQLNNKKERRSDDSKENCAEPGFA